eukprot:2927053-Alexandrium_andersonii.AAC.1
MSASLVGSEMCIRDSAHRGRPAPPPQGHLGALAGPQQLGAPLRGAACCYCLLYTSDAADDM